MEEQLKVLDNPSDNGYGNRRAVHRPSPGSEAFHCVMKEFTVKSHQPVNKRRLKTTWDPSSGLPTQNIIDYFEEIEDDEDIAACNKSSAVAKMTARRGWMRIRHTLDNIAKERKNDASLSWSFLRQHLFHMSDMERARQELYQRYIYKPNTWADGLKEYPYHLLNKPKRVMDWRGQIITLPTNPRHVPMIMRHSKSIINVSNKPKNHNSKRSP